MEGQSHQNALTSLAFDGNAYNLSQLAENYPYQHYIVAGGRNESHYVPLTLPQGIHYQPMAHNYVKFLAENGVSEIQGETPYNNSCVTSSFIPANSSLDSDDQKVRYLRTHNEGAPVYSLSSAEQQIRVQAKESNEGHYNGYQPYSRLAIAPPGFPPKARSRVSRQRATAADRRRRLKIAERLDALQELLPSTKEGGKATLLNDVIEHIKYLQLQIKDLSRSRLGGESTSHPFVFLEGYGHYLFHEEVQNKPLEEMMGKLMELNPTAATQLLGSRGLFVMPMALEEGLRL